MVKWIFLAFLTVPIVEIALFIQVGGLIGLWPTLLLVVLTAIAGTALMRIQGTGAIARLRTSLAEGHDPAGAIAHGALILVAGVLLLTPGFFTDAVGLLLLVPTLRSRIIAWASTRVAMRVASGVQTSGIGFPPGYPHGPRAGPRTPPARAATIDADYEIVDEDDAPPPRPGRSGWTRRPGR